MSAEWATVSDAVKRLPPRERRIVFLRFFKGLTQTEIAEEIGISQMHVSRLLAQTLSQLRGDIGGPETWPETETEPETEAIQGRPPSPGRSYLKMLMPPGPISRPTMMRAAPASSEPRSSDTMPAMTRMAAMIHRIVAAAPDIAKSPNMMRSLP